MRGLLFCCVTVLLLLSTGCVGNQRFQSQVPMTPTLSPTENGMPVAVVEFDDMGELWDRCQITDYTTALPQGEPFCQLNSTLRWIRDQREKAAREPDGGRESIIVTFVHGWKHDAESKDENLRQFSITLSTLQKNADTFFEGCRTNRNTSECDRFIAGSRRVQYIGVYLGWRGTVTRFGTNLTIYDREKAALRTGLISMSEVMARLRNVSKEPLKCPGCGNDDPKYLLFGHSFGGLIVERTVSQMLSAALLPGAEVNHCDDAHVGLEPFADLVILINPAADAIETNQFLDLMKRSKLHTCPVTVGTVRGGVEMSFEPPILVSINARNDSATQIGFQFGHTLEDADKAFRTYANCSFCSSSTDPLPSQKDLYTHTAGHMPFFANYCYIDANTDPGDKRCADIQKDVNQVKNKAAQRASLPADSHKSVSELDANVAMRKELDAGLEFALPGQYGSPIRNLYPRFDHNTCGDGQPCAIWNNTPYWIFTVPPSIVDHHGGFWTPEFVDFISDIVQQTAGRTLSLKTHTKTQ